MEIWAALMLFAGGLFAGGAATFAWSRVSIWRQMHSRGFVTDFGEMRTRWFTGNLGRSLLSVGSFALMVAAVVV